MGQKRKRYEIDGFTLDAEGWGGVWWCLVGGGGGGVGGEPYKKDGGARQKF